jgi:nitrate/TMAO reductase-like tetraheme cytochrome c subunit
VGMVSHAVGLAGFVMRYNAGMAAISHTCVDCHRPIRHGLQNPG